MNHIPLRKALEQANDRFQTIWDHIGFDHDTPEDHERVAQACWFGMQEVDRALSAVSVPTPLDEVRNALTDEDEIAHGEAVIGGDTSDPRAYEGVGRCAYCDDAWPCRTQRGIDRLLAILAAPQPVPEEPRLHDWTTNDKYDYEWCRVCLRVRQANGSSDAKPCKGPAHVELRAQPTFGGSMRPASESPDAEVREARTWGMPEAVPAADEDREPTEAETECTHEDERGSTVMRVRDDRWACAVCGTSFRLVRAGVSPSTGDDRLRARIEALDTIRPDWPDGADYVNRDDVLRALSTGAPDTEEQP